MILSKEDYKYYLEQDKKALRINRNRPRFMHDIIWTFQRCLRQCEYIENCKSGLFWVVIGKFLKLRYVYLSHKLGFSIGFNVFGPGLAIEHYGYLVVNGFASVGKNCRIYEGVTIGDRSDGGKAAIIGDNVLIGTGTKIIGPVKIADNVAIGANSVVVKDIVEPNTSWAGVPARKVSDKGSMQFLKGDE